MAEPSDMNEDDSDNLDSVPLRDAGSDQPKDEKAGQTLDETMGNQDLSIDPTNEQSKSDGTDMHGTMIPSSLAFASNTDDSEIRLSEITQFFSTGIIDEDSAESNSGEITQLRTGVNHNLLSNVPGNTAPGDSAKEPTKVLRDKIPGFHILEELGRGAFGIVFRARDIQLDRQVAIKIPLLRDHNLAEKYLVEARNAAKIDAVGIVPVYQVGETRAGNPFVVQKLIDGSTLSTILHRSQTLPASWTIDTVRKIALAIGKAHLAGLVHRDLKPANILVDRNGEPWVADFGLAVFEEDQRELKGEIAGTPLYMAPEQLTGRADWLDGRADIWALGIILYEMLTGKPPFHAQDFNDLKEQILSRDPKPLRQRNPELPAELDDIFAHCCAKQIGDRYASASELANQLSRVLAECDLPLEEIVLSSAPDGKTTIRSRAITNTQVRKSIFGKATLVQPRNAPAQSSNRWLGLPVAATALICLAGLGLIWHRLNQTTSQLKPASAEHQSLTPGLGISTEPEKAALATDPGSPNATASDDERVTADPNEPRLTLDVERRDAGLASSSTDSTQFDSSSAQQSNLDSADMSTSNSGGQGEVSPNSTTGGSSGMPPTVDSPLTQPELIVSEAGDTAFANLRDAIEVAEPGDTITVLPGTYRTQVTLDKDVEIVGQGSRDEVQLISDGPFALKINNDCRVTLTNLTLSAEGEQTNAIELISGDLQLKACKLSSVSYDCLKAHESTRFTATGCRFESHKHPAVVGQRSCVLSIQNCDFRFDVLNRGIERQDPVVAIQLTESSGTIRECTFTGTGDLGKGISLAGKGDELLISNCKFTSLLHAVELFNCTGVRLTSRNEISECEIGIYAENSSGEILDSSLSHCSWAVSLINESAFSLRNVRVQQTDNVGLWLDNSYAKMTGCEFRGNEKSSIGVFVDVAQPNADDDTPNSGAPVALKSADSTFADNQIGILLVSGNIDIEGGLVTGNQGAGIAVVDYEHLKEALQRRPSSKRDQRTLQATDLIANAQKDAPAIFFMTTGLYELQDCVITDLNSQHRPALGGGLTTKQSGTLVQVTRR